MKRSLHTPITARAIGLGAMSLIALWVSGASAQQPARAVETVPGMPPVVDAAMQAGRCSSPRTLYELGKLHAAQPERVAERFAACWRQLAELAEQIDLPERARERIAKAERLTTQLLATVAFFFATIQAKVEALGLAPEIESAVHQQLIPAIYLVRVAARSTSAERRHALRQRSQELLEPLRRPDSPLQALPEHLRADIETVAAECADLFQRSSSCVEGRNGRLALHHHGKHRLSTRRLAALTAIHNYFIRRPDGTTAAERFFAHLPEPMFDCLIRNLDPPPRPAQKRPRAPRRAYLAPLAA